MTDRRARRGEGGATRPDLYLQSCRRIADMHQAGSKPAEIGRAFGISATGVCFILDRAGTAAGRTPAPEDAQLPVDRERASAAGSARLLEAWNAAWARELERQRA